MQDSTITATSIRSANGADADAIAAIYAVHVGSGTASFDTIPRTAVETRARIADITARGWPYLVSERAGEIVGYAYASQFRDRPAYGFACENSIYIRADCAGQGIGTELLSALIGAATACGFRQMIAVIGGAEPGLRTCRTDALGRAQVRALA
jgi:L-amino acid N-acyltransferase YncA